MGRQCTPVAHSKTGNWGLEHWLLEHRSILQLQSRDICPSVQKEEWIRTVLSTRPNGRCPVRVHAGHFHVPCTRSPGLWMEATPWWRLHLLRSFRQVPSARVAQTFPTAYLHFAKSAFRIGCLHIGHLSGPSDNVFPSIASCFGLIWPWHEWDKPAILHVVPQVGLADVPSWLDSHYTFFSKYGNWFIEFFQCDITLVFLLCN